MFPFSRNKIYWAQGLVDIFTTVDKISIFAYDKIYRAQGLVDIFTIVDKISIFAYDEFGSMSLKFDILALWQKFELKILCIKNMRLCRCEQLAYHTHTHKKKKKPCCIVSGLVNYTLKLIIFAIFTNVYKLNAIIIDAK